MPLFSCFGSVTWQVSSDEGALWDAAVLLLRFGHVAGVVLEVIHDNAISHAVVLLVGLHHGLFEKAVEAKHVAVQSVPGRELIKVLRRGLEVVASRTVGDSTS